MGEGSGFRHFRSAVSAFILDGLGLDLSCLSLRQVGEQVRATLVLNGFELDRCGIPLTI